MLVYDNKVCNIPNAEMFLKHILKESYKYWENKYEEYDVTANGAIIQYEYEHPMVKMYRQLLNECGAKINDLVENKIEILSESPLLGAIIDYGYIETLYLNEGTDEAEEMKFYMTKDDVIYTVCRIRCGVYAPNWYWINVSFDLKTGQLNTYGDKLENPEWDDKILSIFGWGEVK